MLTADLDFSGSSLTLPLGLSSDGNCVTFGGVFQGNGYSIKGLVMDNKGKGEYKNAGLFCSLKDAIIENLVIDSSCSFTGNSAGALSVSVDGSLTVRNTTNNAAVTGTEGVGGFIGHVEELKQESDFYFEDCVNDGKVTGSDYVGGFVGYIAASNDMTITLFNSTNNGNVTGDETGGFVGYITCNNNMTITISNSANNGFVTGSLYVGGFVGDINTNTNVTMIVSNTTNNGNVTVNGFFVGGFVGHIEQTSIFTTVTNSSNNGTVTGILYIGGFVGQISDNSMIAAVSNYANNGVVIGGYYAGGFAGIIFTKSSLNSTVLDIMNSANKGSVSATDYVCGFFYVHEQFSFNVNTTVMNSIHNGSVVAEKDAYGITNNITVARSVVSMGNVTGSSNSYTFWDASTDVDLFFGLDGMCFNCDGNATLFHLNNDTGFYEVVETGEHVDDLLNKQSKQHGYGMFWSNELEFIDYFVEPSSSSSSSFSSSSPSSLSVPLSGVTCHGVSSLSICVVLALAVHAALVH